ncbi:high mobility group B protein 7-like isoform X1 [Diospyros lotus]|uniref:high mobility group B protein 7-like isoform X1 n=1 Tax=Diospyros lotus TaxID=55363 RepID=UPI00225BA0BA|nr:high mobility group B protein 7-like isoform X1 [Diospyros lotus]
MFLRLIFPPSIKHGRGAKCTSFVFRNSSIYMLRAWHLAAASNSSSSLVSSRRVIDCFSFFKLCWVGIGRKWGEKEEGRRRTTAVQPEPEAATPRGSKSPMLRSSAPAMAALSLPGFLFRSEKCNKQVPVVLIDWHDCQMEAQIRRTLDTQMADQEKQSDSVAPEKKRAKSTAEPNPKKAKKEKKGKDPNAPKRPPTAFFLFMDEFRKTYKEANPDCKSVSMVAKEGGEKWKSMTDEVKKPYMDRAAELKEEYKKALQSENNAQGAADDGKCTEEKETKVETVASAAAAADDD